MHCVPTTKVLSATASRGTLRAWLLEEERPWREIVDTVVDAGRGLSAAHREGLLHRDFKPANVLLGTDGRARVTDFGLARSRDQRVSQPQSVPPEADVSSDGLSISDQLTQIGLIVGTPRYMAPEQHLGESLTPAADQYALCVTLWEGLAGAPPFTGAELERDKLAGPPKWTGSGDVPSAIVRAMERGLAPDPAERWPSLDTLLAVLVESARAVAAPIPGSGGPGRARRDVRLAALG